MSDLGQEREALTPEHVQVLEKAWAECRVVENGFVNPLVQRNIFEAGFRAALAARVEPQVDWDRVRRTLNEAVAAVPESRPLGHAAALEIIRNLVEGDPAEEDYSAWVAEGEDFLRKYGSAREDTERCEGCGMVLPNHAHECPAAIDAHLDSLGFPPTREDTERPDDCIAALERIAFHANGSRPQATFEAIARDATSVAEQGRVAVRDTEQEHER
jgi:hypothetical protein